jgi:hypothetical protein
LKDLKICRFPHRADGWPMHHIRSHLSDAGTVLAIGEILVEIMATTPGHGFREPLSVTSTRS